MEQPRKPVGRIVQVLSRYMIGMAMIATVAASPDAQVANVERIKVGIGHSRVLVLRQATTRVAIANPDIADATVTTPTQVLVNGKMAGSTSLVIWDEQDRFTTYEVVVLSTASTDQVMLRVRFAEVKRTAARELGVDWLVQNRKIGGETVTLGGFAGKVSTPNNPLLISENVDMLLSIPSEDISSIIKALEERGLMTTIATPNLSANNGAEARFLAGGEFPVPIVSGSAGLQTVTIVFKEFGIRMNFVPTIVDSNLINVKVLSEVSSLDFNNGIELSGFQIPSLITRRTETTVELQTGRYLVIGGLLSSAVVKSMSRVPILGRIPLISYLFRSESFQNEETELIVLITPSILRGGGYTPDVQIR